MKLFDKVFLTDNGEYAPECRIADTIELLLNKMKLDTYNKQYIIRVTIDTVATRSELEEEEHDL